MNARTHDFFTITVAAMLLTVASIIASCEPREPYLSSRGPRGAEAGEAATPGAPGRWPAEPKDFVPLSDQPWDGIASSANSAAGPVERIAARARSLFASAPAQGAGWNYLRRSSSKDDDVVQDPAAPLSRPNVLRIVFTPDMKRDHEPSVHFIGLPKPVEVFAAWWMKLSPNWTCSPAGCGKITFLFPDHANGAGVTYTNLAGNDRSHYINVATTWPSTGYKFWEPNKATTKVENNRWHRVEWYVRWTSSPDASDGILRWWVDGVLNGDHRDVPFPAIKGFLEFQHAPTRQDPPPAEQYMYVDHTYVSTPAPPSTP